jgi:hypothetical protein
MWGESGRSIRAVMGFDVVLRPNRGRAGIGKVGSIYGVDFAGAITKSPLIEPGFSSRPLM